MDWFSWLSKTGLDPSIVYNYAIIFTQNELQADDIAYFNHEILQSMGISIGKHRLEILKLAKKKKKQQVRSIRPMLWLVLAMQQAKNYVSKHVQTWIGREDSTLAIVPKRIHSPRWKTANNILKRSKRQGKQEKPILINGGPAKMLMLTNGSPNMVDSMSWNNNRFSRTVVQDFGNNEKMADEFDNGEFWSSGVEDMRWDTLFQDLKPT